MYVRADETRGKFEIVKLAFPEQKPGVLTLLPKFISYNMAKLIIWNKILV